MEYVNVRTCFSTGARTCPTTCVSLVKQRRLRVTAEGKSKMAESASAFFAKKKKGKKPIKSFNANKLDASSISLGVGGQK